MWNQTGGLHLDLRWQYLCRIWNLKVLTNLTSHRQDRWTKWSWSKPGGAQQGWRQDLVLAATGRGSSLSYHGTGKRDHLNNFNRILISWSFKQKMSWDSQCKIGLLVIWIACCSKFWFSQKTTFFLTKFTEITAWPFAGCNQWFTLVRYIYRRVWLQPCRADMSGQIIRQMQKQSYIPC